jgi:hypothetical protein
VLLCLRCVNRAAGVPYGRVTHYQTVRARRSIVSSCSLFQENPVTLMTSQHTQANAGAFSTRPNLHDGNNGTLSLSSSNVSTVASLPCKPCRPLAHANFDVCEETLAYNILQQNQSIF